MAASCAQTPALPHQEWRQGRPPPLYNKTGPPTTAFYFWPRRNRTTGTPTILLPDTRTLGQLVQPEQFNEHIHNDFTSTCVREVKLFILYTLQERMHYYSFYYFDFYKKKVLQRMQVCKYVDKNQLKSKSIMLLFLLETEVLKFEQL